MIINQPIIVFSVYQSHLTEATNLHNHIFTIAELDSLKIPHKVLKGVYKGNSELSILVSDKHEQLVLELASAFDQESIIYSDSNRHTTLYVLASKETIPLGVLKSVTQKQAIANDCYTFDSSTSQYWVTV